MFIRNCQARAPYLLLEKGSAEYEAGKLGENVDGALCDEDFVCIGQ